MLSSRKIIYWVPSVYFMQGLPFALVVGVSPILYKTFGISNKSIALYTSIFTLPWVIKFFFAPALEQFATKRTITLTMQLCIAVLTLFLAINFFSPHWISASGILLLSIALASAIHDMSSDGLYLEYLTHQEQAHWVGVRSLCYQSGKLLCQGGVVIAAGFFSGYFGKIDSWTFVFFLLSILSFYLTLYNKTNIPRDVEQKKINQPPDNKKNSYRNVFNEFMKTPHFFNVLFFLLIYNIPEGQLIKIFPLFMLDKTSQGGLNLNVDQVGMIYGGLGVVSMLIGVTLSGLLLTRFTLKKCLVPFTLFATLCNIGYLLLKCFPGSSIWFICLCVSLAQFGFGLCNSAYMLFLIQLFAKRPYSMSLYAVGTAVMQLGFMLAGTASGYIQSWLGYTGFFIWIAVAGVSITMISIYSVRNVR